MPGAELSETVDENHWKADMAVKLGPISLSFDTDVTREAVDEAASSVTLTPRPARSAAAAVHRRRSSRA